MSPTSWILILCAAVLVTAVGWYLLEGGR